MTVSRRSMTLGGAVLVGAFAYTVLTSGTTATSYLGRSLGGTRWWWWWVRARNIPTITIYSTMGRFANTNLESGWRCRVRHGKGERKREGGYSSLHMSMW